MASGCLLAQLVMLYICAVEMSRASAAAPEVTLTPQGLKIECGDNPHIPANVTYSGGHDAGLYAEGRSLECSSQRVVHYKSYLHIIYNVFGRDCGGTVSRITSTIRIRLQHTYGLVVPRDKVHVLSCNYAKHYEEQVTSWPVEKKKVNAASSSDGESDNSLDDSGVVGNDAAGGEGRVGEFVVGDTNVTGTGSAANGTRPAGNTTSDDLEGEGSMDVEYYGKHKDISEISDNAGTDVGVDLDGIVDTSLYNPDVKDFTYFVDKPKSSSNSLFMASAAALAMKDEFDELLGTSTLGSATTSREKSWLVGESKMANDDTSLATSENAPAFLLFNNPAKDLFSPLGSSVQSDASQPPKTKPNWKSDTKPAGAMFPGAVVAPSPSVLQLNLIDEDGQLTAVVYPGKPVALELHSAHQSPFGTPFITQCSLTNPLEKIDGGPQHQGFSAKFVHDGCGLGDVLPKSAGFRRGRQGYTTPFFAVSPTWAQQGALLFACDVIICPNMGRCKQICPPSEKLKIAPGAYDLNVTLDSQVVTPCPPQQKLQGVQDQDWRLALLPECMPGGRQQALDPNQSSMGIEQNLTDSLDSDSIIGIQETPTSWLAQHLHYIIIVCVLVLLILVFMCGTFFKLAAIHYQTRLSRKLPADAERALVENDTHHDQTTQTTRPLPRLPSGGRGHGHGRHRGDGASTTLVQTSDTHRQRPLSDSHLAPLEASLDLSPPLSVSQLADDRRPGEGGRSRDDSRPRSEGGLARDESRLVSDDGRPHCEGGLVQDDSRQAWDDGRPRIVDRPSIENPPDLTSFENAQTSPPFEDNDGHAPFENVQGYDNVPNFPQTTNVTQIPSSHFDISRRSRSFQTTTTVEETNSERHVSFVEVKTPRPARDNIRDWTGHEYLGTFTGGNPGSGTFKRGNPSSPTFTGRNPSSPTFTGRNPSSPTFTGANSNSATFTGGNPNSGTYTGSNPSPGTFTEGNPSSVSEFGLPPVNVSKCGNSVGTPERERGVVLGVNSLRRHKDREQHVTGSSKFFTTPAPCSEDSTPKELSTNSLPRGHEASAMDHSGYYAKAGIRTAPHRGSRTSATVVIVNAQEETTRL